METIIKSTLTLFALTDPIALVPLLLASIAHLPEPEKKRFIRLLCVFVFLCLMGVGLFGNAVLSTLGVSVGALRIAGGIAALVAGVQMLLAPPKATMESVPVGLSPLGIPLLVGPAAMSFMIANSSVSSVSGVLTACAGPAIVALACFMIFRLALRIGHWMGPDAITVTEKLSAFLLAALSVEMIVSGLRELFPALGGIAAVSP